jgi:hypothetical protein
MIIVLIAEKYKHFDDSAGNIKTGKGMRCFTRHFFYAILRKIDGPSIKAT